MCLLQTEISSLFPRVVLALTQLYRSRLGEMNPLKKEGEKKSKKSHECTGVPSYNCVAIPNLYTAA